MSSHNLFYYPYGSFYDRQAPLLKVVALYFDKLYLLDPEKASSAGIGVGEAAADVQLLEQHGILERVAPEEVLLTHEAALADAIRADLADPAFLQLCEASGRASSWTLALAKVPKAIRDDPSHQEYGARKPRDQAMQRLMGELPRRLVQDGAGYSEVYAEVTQHLSAEQFVYTENRPGLREVVEYRYADYPLPLGESIMLNHALFGSLLHSGATPLTDDPFHSQVLQLKLQRARQNPEVRQILADRATKQNLLAISALSDAQLDLPMISPQVKLEDILEHRQRHASELQQVRDRLGWLARRIREAPYSKEFEAELEHTTIPDIAKDLEEARKARDAWLKSKRGRLALSAAGIAIGAAATIAGLVLSPTPLLPVGLGLISSAGIPSLELALDWKEGKQAAKENGLHYLLKV